MKEIFIPINDEKAQLYINKIIQADGEPYIVGGYVRDFLLNKESHDIDIEVYNLNFQELIDLIGEDGVVQGNFGVIVLKDSNISFSIPRSENKIGVKHQDFEINMDPFMTPKKATIRRDFTINALMYNIKNQKIIDFHNGLEDLEKKQIRHVSSKFTEDPLRVLRALRFSFTLGFTINEETLKLCKKISPKLKYISSSRKYQELKKTFIPNFNNDSLYYLNDLLLNPYEITFKEINKNSADNNYENKLIINQTIYALKGLNHHFNDYDNKSFFVLFCSILLHNIDTLNDVEFNEEINDNNNYTSDANDNKHPSESLMLAIDFLDDVIPNKKDRNLISSLIKDQLTPLNFENLPIDKIVNLLSEYKNTFPLLLLMSIYIKSAQIDIYNDNIFDQNFKENYEKFYIPSFKLFKYYEFLKNKFNGNYFLVRGFEPKNIKELQRVNITKFLYEYRIKLIKETKLRLEQMREKIKNQELDKNNQINDEMDKKNNFVAHYNESINSSIDNDSKTSVNNEEDSEFPLKKPKKKRNIKNETIIFKK